MSWKQIFYLLLLFHFHFLFSQGTNIILNAVITTKDSIDFYVKKLKPISKALSFSKCNAMRVSSIFLDGSKQNLDEINSLRKRIIAEYTHGISFVTLVNKYTMDNNKEGDLGWFDEGQMEEIFQNEIKKHKKGAIFTVDIPSNNWFYVVLKTFDDREKTKITYILNEN